MEGFKVQVEIPVQWRDMDAAQHVNNVVYLKWVEAARIKFFTGLNGPNLKNEDNIGPILAWQECKYIKPVTYPDTVIVGIRKIQTLEDRIVTETHIYSKAQDALVAISNQRTVAYDFLARRKAMLPLNWIYNES